MKAQQNELEAGRSEIEKIMLGLPPSRTDTERRMYLAGFIDCLHSRGDLSPDVRDTLYAEYCF